MATEPKSGLYTTEFWVAAAAQLIALLVAIGVIATSDGPNLTEAITKGIVGLGAFVAAGVTLWKYIQSRTDLKIIGGDTEPPTAPSPPSTPGNFGPLPCLLAAALLGGVWLGAPAPARAGELETILRQQSALLAQQTQLLQRLLTNQGAAPALPSTPAVTAPEALVAESSYDGQGRLQYSVVHDRFGNVYVLQPRR